MFVGLVQIEIVGVVVGVVVVIGGVWRGPQANGSNSNGVIVRVGVTAVTAQGDVVRGIVGASIRENERLHVRYCVTNVCNSLICRKIRTILLTGLHGKTEADCEGADGLDGVVVKCDDVWTISVAVRGREGLAGP